MLECSHAGAEIIYHLPMQFFALGQIYAALSRALRKEKVKILTEINGKRPFANNCVYKEII